MEQKQNKKKSKYTIVDAVVLIGLIILLYLVFLLVFGGIERITRFGRANDDEVALSCTFRVEDLDLELYEIDPTFTEDCPFLHVGDVFYMNGNAVGEVVSFWYENREISTDTENEWGQLIYLDDPYSVDVLITVKLDGRESAQGYSIGDIPLHVDDQMLFSTGKFEREAKICAVGVYEEPDSMPDAVPADAD